MLVVYVKFKVPLTLSLFKGHGSMRISYNKRLVIIKNIYEASNCRWREGITMDEYASHPSTHKNLASYKFVVDSSPFFFTCNPHLWVQAKKKLDGEFGHVDLYFASIYWSLHKNL
jgi:hypothetical protein